MSSTNPNPTPLRLVGYARVSTAAQALHGVSVPEQERAIHEWCEANGYELVAVHVDNGLSGTLPMEQRPGLAAALLNIESGAADGLAFRGVDRLARELHVQEAVFSYVWHHGGRAFDVPDGEVKPDDPRDPYRVFIRQVLGAASQLNASIARRNMQLGRSLKHRRGGYAGGNTVRFGEQVSGTGKQAVRLPDPDRVHVIDNLVQLRTGGATFAEIADRLNESGVPTARGGRWHAMSVKRVADRAVA